MTNDLNIGDSSTWLNDWLAETMPVDITDPVGLYRELDHPETTDPLVCDLRDRTIQCITVHYGGCIAYHCCRPLQPGSYRQNGLWTTSEDRLRDLAKECYGMLDGWEAAFRCALTNFGLSHYLNDWYGGTVGLSFLPFEHYCSGSHFMEKMSYLLGEAGTRRWQELQAITMPLIISCRLPFNWIKGEETEGDLLAGYARELLRAYMSEHLFLEKYESQRAIHVLADIPPEFIIELPNDRR